MGVQTQYVFIRDALSELVVCGETEMTAAEVRTKGGNRCHWIPDAVPGDV